MRKITQLVPPLGSKALRRLILGFPSFGQFLFGNGQDWVGSNVPAFHSIVYGVRSALAVNTASFGIASIDMTASDTNQGVGIPSGSTAILTEVTINIKTGATAGTYTVDMIAVDHAGTQTVLCTVTGGNNAWLRGKATNLASGIMSLGGASALKIGLKNRATSPGALANENQVVEATFTII